MPLNEQIAANRRRSTLLFCGFLVLYLAIGWAVSTLYGDVAILIAGVIAIVVAASALWFGDDMAVRIAGGKQIRSRQELPELWDSVETMSIAAGVEMPRIFVSPDPSPNAFAAGRSQKQALICVNRGLLRALDRAELDGVVAHEIAHIRNLDVRLMTYAAVLAGSLALLSEIFMRAWIFSSSGRHRDVHPLVAVAAVLVIVLAPIAAVIIQLAISRRREYLADATAADLTRYPQGLASALEKITGRTVLARGRSSMATAHLYISPVRLERMAFVGKMFSTHPPSEERIKRLLEISGGVRHQSQERYRSPQMDEITGPGSLLNGSPSHLAGGPDSRRKLPQPPAEKLGRKASPWSHSDDEGFA